MANFSYNDYQNVVAQAEANNNNPKIGYFKLKNDGDIAIARLNISSTEDLMFASVHTIGIGGKWIKVSCLNPLGSSDAGCPLCSAYAANKQGAVGKPAKKVFIPMMVSYRDQSSATGYTAPAPVIWDRPAVFSRELANKLMVAGDLRDTLVLITRNGKAGDMQTTYSMDILPANHSVFKPEMIPNDFSAFNNFNIARHSYWEKTVEEINAYLATGQFPERAQVNTTAPAATATPVNSVVPEMGMNTSTVTPPTFNSMPVNTYTGTPAPQPAVTVTPAPVQTAPVTVTPTTETPTRNFSGFSF